MDRERGRDLKRSGISGGQSSPAKRRQRALSGRISSSAKSTSPLSPFPSEKKVAVLSGTGYVGGGGGGGGGGEEESAMERWKKEKAKAFRWGSGINEGYSRTGDRGGGISGSDEGEQHLSRPPLSRSFGLQSKASEDGNAVGPAVVPRKLRSAMNKRSRLSASPPLPDLKNKLSASPPLPDSRNKCYARNGNHMPCVNGARRCKRNMLNEPVTKAEEEAAETLSALASMIPDGRPVKISEDGGMSEENSHAAATVVSNLEASKEVSTEIFLPGASPVATNPSFQIEPMAETAKPEPSALEQPAITSGNQEFGPGSNGTVQPGFQRTSPSKNEQAKNAILRDSSNSSNLLEASLYSYCGNRSAQSNALSVHKPEIRPWPFGSASAEHQVRSFKQKADNPTRYVCGEDTSHALQPGLPSSGNGHLAMSSSSKAALWPDSAATGCRTTSNGVSSNGTDLHTGKLPQVSADRRSSWKRCTTHVYISHTIQRYQKTQIKHQFPFLTNRSKAKGGTISGVQDSNKAIGMSSLNSRTAAGNRGSIMESKDESRIQMLSGSSMQQQQAPHHSIMPFPFPHGPSLCPDRLAAMTQQLQLPHQIGNSIYGPYGPQLVVAGGKLQQIWQAHMAQYRPPLGIPAWQTMRLQDPSLLPCAQPPSTFPQPSREMQVGSYQSPSSLQLQELLPIPSSSSLRAKKPHGSGFGTEGAPQLQLLCNAQRM
ncbi:uncharacterized protein LOC103706201 isoform X2 [Phoenix dactylifera]|uniref:Uncharacterized protein LOC103706201 isoform X2 n=1 Tax=Phoenix dactylifera TaxID=42345 RepID=A0A8B8ZH45_PHODC|nr:uncharacterized protein LOC103706201 isoform X2 [Phoenix dactylifera]